MTATAIYERIQRAIIELPEDTRNDITAQIACGARLSELAALALDLREEMHKEAAKNTGRASRLAAFKRLIKASDQHRDCARAPRMEGDAMTYCNGFVCVVLNAPLPIDCAVYELSPLELYNKFASAAVRAVPLPSIADIKAAAADWKASHAKTDKPIYKLPGIEAYFDAARLADTLAAVGGIDLYLPEAFRTGCLMQAARVIGEDGAAVIMPTRPAPAARDWWNAREIPAADTAAGE